STRPATPSSSRGIQAKRGCSRRHLHEPVAISRPGRMMSVGAIGQRDGQVAGSLSQDPAERRERRRHLLLLLPALLTLVALFVYPLGGILFRSVYKTGYTLDYYRHAFRTPVYLTVIGLTFRTAFLVALICLLLGYPLAYVLAQLRPRLARLLIIVVVLPF